AGDDGRIKAEQFEARCDASSLWQARHPTWLNCPSMADKAGDDAILRACGTGIGKCRLLSITGCGSAKASVAERPIALPPCRFVAGEELHGRPAPLVPSGCH